MRVEIYREGRENLFSKFEGFYQAEIPYLEQTYSWKLGMRYAYSPEYYPLSEKQFIDLNEIGCLVGGLVDEICQNKAIEFRVDYVVDTSRNLFITEVQTDDRGLPAMAIARNAKGPDANGILPGVIKPFNDALVNLGENKEKLLLITYPKEEEFYYAGFYDYAKFSRAEQDGTKIVVADSESILNNPDGLFEIRQQYSGLIYQFRPDYIWNFSEQDFEDYPTIQPKITKQILYDVWKSKDANLKKAIPRTTTNLNDPSVKNNKNDWILKPIDGRWSKGVVIGNKVKQEAWNEALTDISDLVAQKYVEPKDELFFVRSKEGKYERRHLFARLEGYYIKSGDQWILADVLATCTPDIPVHGKRDAIMIPGKVDTCCY